MVEKQTMAPSSAKHQKLQVDISVIFLTALTFVFVILLLLWQFIIKSKLNSKSIGIFLQLGELVGRCPKKGLRGGQGLGSCNLMHQLVRDHT